MWQRIGESKEGKEGRREGRRREGEKENMTSPNVV